MKKQSKFWLITAFILITIGFSSFFILSLFIKFDYTKLSTVTYKTQTHDVNCGFTDILINVDTADVEFKLSSNDKCSVTCFESEKEPHTVKVEDKKLIINYSDNRNVLDYISIQFSKPKLTINLTKQQYNSLTVKCSTGDVIVANDFSFNEVDITVSTGDVKLNANSSEVKITSSTGRISVKDINANNLTLSASTGDIDLKGVNCTNLTISLSTGELEMRNVIATEKFNIKTTTGDVDFESCDASEIYIKTTTGDVEGSLLSGKTFTVNTTTGKKRVPSSTSGGKCEITTSTGDVEIMIKQ